MKPLLNRALRWIGCAYLIYLGICLLVLMPAMNILAPGLARDALDRELRSELLLFNPFNFAFEARGISLHEDDGHQPLAFRQLTVDLSLSSIWEPGIVLDAFVIDELEVHVLRKADGSFHFEDLLESDDTEESANTDPIPYFTIRDVLVDAHTLRFTDRTRPGPYTSVQRDLNIRKHNLTTVPDRSGQGVLELTGDSGGRLSWNGSLDIAAGQSTGQLQLQNIDLTPLWRYEAQNLAFVTHSARLDARINYRVEWNQDLQLLLDDSQLRLHQWDLGPQDEVAIPDTRIRLADLSVDGIAVDLLAQQVDVQQVSISGFDVQGYDDEGAPSLLRLFTATTEDDSANNTAAQSDSAQGLGTEPDSDPEQEAAWTVSLKQFELGDSRVDWRTDFLTPEFIRITPIDITASSIRWPASEASPYSLALGLNDDTQLSIDGALQINSGDGNASIVLTDWQLPWLNPLVNEQARTDISRGTLSLSSVVQLRDFSPGSLSADLQIDDFATQLHESGDEAFTLQQFAVEGAAVDIAAQSVRIERVSLQRPTGSLHIREDGTINVNGIVRERPTAAAVADTEEGEPWHIVLDQLALREGRLDFADASLPIPFKTLIADITADAQDIDSDARSSLTLTMQGSVDGYAPVLIEGSGRPLAPTPDGKLRLNFRGVDIATMSPYSGTYAGYTIDSGTLSLDLNYALQGTNIEGDNHILISQMQLGEPVESELAINVPLKLGLALLTDSNGVIDLGVPVSGDVDDPQFSLGGVIGKAIANVIIKAVTAPFKLLAGLVGSEDDLENIAFIAGDSSLSTEGLRAVSSLATALNERPQLNLRISGGTDSLNDTRAIAETMLRASLIEDGLDATSIDLRNDDFLQALESRFSALAAQAASDQNEDTELPDTDTQWNAILESIVVPASVLRDLGTARAAAAKKELVITGGIDAARIAIAYDAGLLMSGIKMLVDS